MDVGHPSPIPFPKAPQAPQPGPWGFWLHLALSPVQGVLCTWMKGQGPVW